VSPIAERVAGALLVALAAGCWANSFAGVFQFDDAFAIAGAGRIDAPAPTLRESLAAIRPLTRSTFWAERRLFGLEPAGYHLLPVALHLGSAFLLFRLVRRLGADWPPGTAESAALLFLVHPLATEAVTYLSGRASLLAAFFSLLAVERWTARERGAASWSSLVAFALALAAKETAAILPVALVLVDRARAPSPERARWRAYLPYGLVLALFFAATAVHPVYRRLLGHSLALRGPLENLAVQPLVALESLSLYVAPWRLNLDHDLRPERSGAVGLVVAAALVVALAAAAVLSLRKRSPTGFGLLWHLVHLVPTCSLVARNDLLSERNLYLPSAGLAIAVAALGALLAERARRAWPRVGATASRVAVVALLAALALVTWRRNSLYADPVALWRDAVRKSPDKARPHANLGWSLYVAGELDAALGELREALRLEPDDAMTRANLARVWEKKLREATHSGRHDVRTSDSPPEE
jgi:tetratricopeptide (TPR) repeat protein